MSAINLEIKKKIIIIYVLFYIINSVWLYTCMNMAQNPE